MVLSENANTGAASTLPERKREHGCSVDAAAAAAAAQGLK